MTSPLSAPGRAQALRTLASDPLDVLVIGGGVVGAGCALDAATRGLRVGLVERRDWASGTSSRSSKLVHGGLRYLEMLDFGLVREALRERGLIMDRLAPHLTRPVPFLYPLRGRGWERPYVGAGILLYDLLARQGARGDRLPGHRHLSRRAALRLAPALRADALVGAVQYHDGQIDDARHTMSLVRTAAEHGATCAARSEVVDLLRDGERVVGAVVEDRETGDRFDVRARVVLNATGVWTDEIRSLLGRTGGLSVRASKGVHLMVPRDRIDAGTGLILRTESSVLFVIPWGEHWIVGTTDTDWELDKVHPAASAADVRYLIERVNRVLRVPLGPEDIVGVYAGLRPLLSGESEATSALSREHVVTETAPGLVMVAGGKYTTYRVMAADAVDAAVASSTLPAGPCITHRVPVVGAEGFAPAWARRTRIAQETGLAVDRVEHLLRRFGGRYGEVVELGASDPTLLQPLPGAPAHLRAEVVHATRHEGALHLDDVLTRRTHISIETTDRGTDAAAAVATLMGRELGWDDDRQAAEIDGYRRRVQAERFAQEQADDVAADLARRAAPDPVSG